MSVGPESQIECHRRGDVVVLRPVGALDLATADQIRVLALEAHAPVVIDLGACVGFGIDALRRLAEEWELFRPQMSLVCRDPGDVRMLDASNVSDPLPLFATVDHAAASLCSSGRRWAPVKEATNGAPQRSARTVEAAS